jgi:hypothetical protein
MWLEGGKVYRETYSMHGKKYKFNWVNLIGDLGTDRKKTSL